MELEKFTFKDYLTMDALVKKSIDEGNVSDMSIYMALRSKIYLNIKEPLEEKLVESYIENELKQMENNR